MGEEGSIGVWCECDVSVGLHCEWGCVFEVCPHTHVHIAGAYRWVHIPAWMGASGGRQALIG